MTQKESPVGEERYHSQQFCLETQSLAMQKGLFVEKEK